MSVPTEATRNSLSALTSARLRRETIAAQVYEEIKAAILTKEIQPGTRLKAEELSNYMGTSKTPVREALQKLTAVGLAVPSENGLEVLRPSSEAITTAFDFRLILELGVLTLAAAQTPDELVTIQQVAEQSLKAAESRDSDRFSTLDKRFHTALAHGTRNIHLIKRLEETLELTSALRGRDIQSTRDSINCAKEHVAIAEALLVGNEQTATQIMRRHITDVKEWSLKAYKTESERNSAASRRFEQS